MIVSLLDVREQIMESMLTHFEKFDFILTAVERHFMRRLPVWGSEAGDRAEWDRAAPAGTAPARSAASGR